ncbi:hypothetical protein [uncultured Dialister sp.]|nr:hypothetical protein [uncultured Dialister sp.]
MAENRAGRRFYPVCFYASGNLYYNTTAQGTAPFLKDRENQGGKEGKE